MYGIDLDDLYAGAIRPSTVADLVVYLPAGSALWAAMRDPRAWTPAEHLAADQVDALTVLVWQRTKDGARNLNQPKPIPRPGVVDPAKKTFGEGALELEEFDAWLADQQAAMTPIAA